MGLSNQSNNRNWGKEANLAAAREFYSCGELNDIKTSDAAGIEYPSDNFSPYEDSDIGSSLQEVKHEGNIALASRKRGKSAALAAAISPAAPPPITITLSDIHSRPQSYDI